MPTYVYECPKGHRMEGFWPIVERPKRTKCVCGEFADQIITAVAVHTCATFSRDIDDEEVRATRDPGDGSYLDPTLSYDWETGKVVAPITSEKQRRQLMEAKGLFEKPPSDKAKDVRRLKEKKPVHFVPTSNKNRRLASA